MPADTLLNQLVWILPASITIAIGIVTIIMGLFGGNQMPVEGKVSIQFVLPFILLMNFHVVM